jgi:hypothetical protein
MEAIAHSPSFAKKVHIPQSVGKDYVAADKGKTFKHGGDMKRMAFGGETASDKKAKTRLANMREEDAEVAEGRQKQQREDRLERYRRNIAMDDLKIAQKQGKTYDKWFEDNRKAQLKEGILRQDAYDEGKGYEMLTPKQHRQALTSSGMKKGGEVKESKAMVGKEVAFMKKKGAPAKMIKHEMSEMKGMKAGGRVRRMAGGGMGDPFELSDEDRANYEKNGAKNLESIKNFFGFGKKKDEAPIDRSRDKPEPVIRPSMGGPSASSATSRVSSQSPRTRRENEDTLASDAAERDDAASMDKTAKGPQFTSSIAKDEGEYSGSSFKPENRPSQAKEPARPRKPTTVSRTRETTSVTAAPSKGKAPAKIDSEKLLRDAEEEVLRKKPTAMTEQMRKAPTINDLYRGQKSMGDEIGDVLKSFRETIRGGLQKGKERQESKGSTMYAKGGNVKRMRYGGEPDGGMGPQPKSARLTLSAPEPQSARLTLSPSRTPTNPDMIKNKLRYGSDYERPMEAPSRSESKVPPPPIEPPQPRPVSTPNPKSARAFNQQQQFAEMMPSFANQPRGIKAGGQVKKMAEGGYAKADGAASRGKTQPKMVKMASGGFVKNADGCAQRGKTKAFQVKMKNGGMC